MNIIYLSLISCFILSQYFISGHLIQKSRRIKEPIVKDHLESSIHDTNVDHEVFLGKEESKKFDKLSVEDSKLNLKRLVIDKIDNDKDGYVTKEELESWIKSINEETHNEDLNTNFKMYINGSDDFIDFDVYFERTYGDLNEEELDKISRNNLKIMKNQDIKKWRKADKDNDNRLSKEEFNVFLHPQNYLEMKSLVIDEALEVSDKDGDGALDVDEYMNDLWPSTETKKPSNEWVERERELFSESRDFDKNGKMDRFEIGEWLMPTDYDANRAETIHLISEADKDHDGKLSVDEIIESHDLFAGSQATAYGRSLKHQEL